MTFSSTVAPITEEDTDEQEDEVKKPAFSIAPRDDDEDTEDDGEISENDAKLIFSRHEPQENWASTGLKQR